MPVRCSPGFRVAASVAAALALAACGKKGPPLPPLRPLPARILDLGVARVDDRIELRFTVPATNLDGSTPPAVSRVELRRIAEAPDAPRPAARRLVAEGELVATLVVDRAPESADLAASERAGPRPGDLVTYTDQVPATEGADPATAPVWWYVAVAVAGRDRQGEPSGVVGIPLGERVPAPTGLELAYDERQLTLTWQSVDEGDRFVVVDVPEGDPGRAEVLTPSPIETPEFSLPVEFGRRRCFAVRAARVEGPRTVQSAASLVVCETPVDTFPPPVPGGLVAVQDGSAVTLRWRASGAADLAGYIVLRGEGTDETLRPLTSAPVSGTSYRDADVRVGGTYTYAVVAIDRAEPPNASAGSNRETVVIR